VNIWYFSPYAGGPGVGNALRAFHLSKLWKEMGHTCTVFPSRYHHLLSEPGPLPQTVVVEGVKYQSLRAREYNGNGKDRLLNMLDYCRSMLSVEGERPDVIIVSSPHPFSIFPGRRLAKKHGAKLVFEVRDLWPMSLTEIAKVPDWHPFVKVSAFTEKYAYMHADLVASLLGNAEPYMRTRGLAEGKFVHVPNGINLDVSLPTQPRTQIGVEAAQKLRQWQDEGRKVIIHPGSQGVPNAVDILINAVHLLKNDKRFGILLVGTGTENQDLRGSAEGLEQVAFFPPVPKSEALWLTAHSDIGYAGGKKLPIYQYGTSFNKVTDFVRFGLPVLEIIDTGAGLAASGDSPSEIAAAITQIIDKPVASLTKNHAAILKSLDYKEIARRYADAFYLDNGD